MTTKRKTILTLVILVALNLVLIIFLIYPLFSQIKKESADFISEKNKLIEFENKDKNLSELKSNYKKYQAYSEKIDGLLVDSAEPIKFIEFLEKEAENSTITIEISPSLPQRLGSDPWPSMNFQMIAVGSFPNLLKYLEKLESAPYLIEIVNFNIGEATQKETKTGEQLAATFLIKAYSQ